MAMWEPDAYTQPYTFTERVGGPSEKVNKYTRLYIYDIYT